MREIERREVSGDRKRERERGLRRERRIRREENKKERSQET